MKPLHLLALLVSFLLIGLSTGCGEDEITVRFNITVTDGNTGNVIPDGEVKVFGYMPAGIGTSGELYSSRRSLVNGQLQFMAQMDDRVEEFIFDFYLPGGATPIANTRIINCPDGTTDLNFGCRVNDAREFNLTLLVFD